MINKRWHHYISGGGDPDVAAFISNAGITEPTVIAAYEALVAAFKDPTADLWTSLELFYGFAGGTATAHGTNLKNPNLYNVTWSGTWTHGAQGSLGDGVASYGETGYSPDTNLDPVAHSWACASNGTAEEPARLWGCRNGAGTYEWSLTWKYAGSIYAVNGNTSYVGASPGPGRYSGVRSASNDFKFYKATTQIGTDSTACVLPVEEVYLGTLNAGGSPSGNYSTNRLQYFGIWRTNLSGAQLSALDTALAAFMTALGR